MAGDVRLMQSEPIKKDKISKSCMVAQPRWTEISKKHRRHMNGRNIESVGPSMS